MPPPIIHKMSFYLGYEAAWEQALQAGLEPTASLLDAKQMYEIRSAQLTDMAKVWVEGNSVFFVDIYKQKWKITPTGDKNAPFTFEYIGEV